MNRGIAADDAERLQADRGSGQFASALSSMASSLRTPPRYAQPFSLTPLGQVGDESMGARVQQKHTLSSNQMASSWDVSPLPPLLPSGPPSCQKDGESCIRETSECDTLDLSTPVARSQLG